MMNVAIVMPPAELAADWLKQPLEAIRTRYADRPEHRLTFHVAPPFRERFRALLGDQEILVDLSQTSTSVFHEVVFVQTDPPWPTEIFATAPGAERLVLDRAGGIRPVGHGITEKDDPPRTAHVFNRLGPHKAEHASAFYYFPYGYLYRDVSWGPVDAFGHRVTHDLDALADREPNHKLIIGYGGSTAWGWECLPHQIWTAYLEQFLNEQAGAAGSPWRYSAINFAGPGHVVLHQMMNHLLFAHRLRPDIVVALDGCNDLWNGQMCDPFLVAHDIVYQETQEQWAQILHESKDRPRTYAGGGQLKRAINQPGANLKAYVTRARQFRALVEGTGGHFIWALQPMLFSKAALAPQENGISSKWTPVDENIRQNMPQLYELLSRELPAKDRAVFVNLHEAFRSYGAEAHLFWDIAHTSPDGHRAMAKHIAQHIEAAVVPRLTEAGGERR